MYDDKNRRSPASDVPSARTSSNPTRKYSSSLPIVRLVLCIIHYTQTILVSSWSLQDLKKLQLVEMQMSSSIVRFTSNFVSICSVTVIDFKPIFVFSLSP